MNEIPGDLKAKLDARIREQIAAEVRGDVSALYEFTWPTIRTKRITERGDEPALSLSEIKKFVGLVRKAEVESIGIESFSPSAQRFAGYPAAVVITTVRYNGSNEASRFRCIWVYSGDTWFTTALGKVGGPPS